MKRTNHVALWAMVLGVSSSAACAMGATDSLSAGRSSDNGVGSSSGGFGGGLTTGSGSSSGSGGPTLPPETKTESNYQSPVATGSTVWTANPTSGRVAYVDAVTYGVQTVQAGNGPTYLAAVPNPDPNATTEAAIVLNVRSQDATLLERNVQSGQLTPTRFAPTGDANSWAMAPSGRWAIAWSNASLVTNPDATQGFQDMAVLDLTAATPGAASVGASPVSVGYRPSQVVYAHDETHAFAVTQDGISVIDLTATPPAATQNFPLSAPILPDAGTVADAGVSGTDGGDGGDAATSAPPPPIVPGPPDVSFTTDGAYALVRRDNVPAISVVSLHDGSTTQVLMPSSPTDLTLAPDGTFAMAVLRDSSSVAVLPLPGIATAPTVFTTIGIPGEVIGRAVIAQGAATGAASALLFTTVGGIDRMTILALGPSPTYRTVSLHAPIVAVFATPDAQNAVVLHSVTPAAGSTVKGAFSVVPVAKSLSPKIVSLTAPPTAVALSPSGDRALVTTNDTSSIFGVDLVMLPSMAVVPFDLASPPTAVGIAAAAGADGTGFVAQNNADGRITFIDLSAATARTITGFELGARIAVGGGAQ